MKLFFDYIRHHRLILLAFFICAGIFTGSFILYRLPVGAALYPSVLCLLVLLLFAVFDFLRVKRRHEELSRIKTLTAELIDTLPEPSSVEEEDYAGLVRSLCAQIRLSAEKSAAEYRDMTDYYTVWAHQIKTPIASMRLTLQNADSPQARRLLYDLGRIERYVDMVMTYLRLDSDTSDLVIREHSLDAIVRGSVKKLAGDFIVKRIGLDYGEVDLTVLTDEKWLSFVIGQVLSNALKYTPSGTVSVYTEAPRTLCIRDTGIGIDPADLPRIFENGFTGQNGRTDKAASGIGLYLCSRICKKLGHTLSAASEPGVGTVIRIGFPESDRAL